jgi:hypothetical protein
MSVKWIAVKYNPLPEGCAEKKEFSERGKG